jgi:hypothetical protein
MFSTVLKRKPSIKGKVKVLNRGWKERCKKGVQKAPEIRAMCPVGIENEGRKGRAFSVSVVR